MKKYLVMMLVIASFLVLPTHSRCKPCKPSRSSQRAERDKCDYKCCYGPDVRFGVDFGYYAYPPYYDRVQYWGNNPFWGGPYYYAQYPNYRSIGVELGWGYGSPIW